MSGKNWSQSLPDRQCKNDEFSNSVTVFENDSATSSLFSFNSQSEAREYEDNRSTYINHTQREGLDTNNNHEMSDDASQTASSNEMDPKKFGQASPKYDILEKHNHLHLFHFNSQNTSLASFSTETPSHEISNPPLHLPNFRSARGCSDSSDYIVRCFVARLRAGIVVVKHGRSRWSKSQRRILHVHTDGLYLSWKRPRPDDYQRNINTSNGGSTKRPPQLDLTTCKEVRHAWTPDPVHPRYTGTPILRRKCEPADAHKSFALIFPTRTVDITATTADQCRVMMEGFSALCCWLQVTNRTSPRTQGGGRGNRNARENQDEATASITLTSTTSTMPSPEISRRKGGEKGAKICHNNK